MCGLKQPFDNVATTRVCRELGDLFGQNVLRSTALDPSQDVQMATGCDGLKGNRIESLFAKTLDKPLEERERAGEGGGGDKMVRMEDDLTDFFRVGVPQGGEDVQVTVEGGLEGTERGAGFGTVTEPPKDDGEVAVF